MKRGTNWIHVEIQIKIEKISMYTLNSMFFEVCHIE